MGDKIQGLKLQIAVDNETRQSLVNQMNLIQNESRALFTLDAPTKMKLDDAVAALTSMYMMGIPPKNAEDHPIQVIFANYEYKNIYIDFDPDKTINNPAGDRSEQIISDIKKITGDIPLDIKYDKIVPISGAPNNHATENKIAPPLKQFQSGVSLEDIQCKRPLVLFLKTKDHSPLCLTIGTADILSRRNIIDTSANTTFSFAQMKASEFVLSGPTFDTFGIKSSLFVDPNGTCLASFPEDCFIQILFDVTHPGYGNGTNAVSQTSNTVHHVVGVRVNDTNNVMCAVIDGVWDEKEQKPLDKNDKQCGYLYGFKGGFP